MKTTSHYRSWRAKAAGLGVMGLALLFPGNVGAATSFSQDTSTGLYTMKSSGSTVRDVLNYIEKNSNYVFMYTEGVQQQLSKSVDVSVTDKKIETILSEVCGAAGLKYSISGRQVTISPDKVAKQADATKVTGTIFDENGEPMIGATVLVKGTNIAVSTDVDGNFSIDARKGQQLQVSYIGYAPKVVSVTSSPMTINMTENNNVLDEVVVIGYGTVKKKDLTGAVASVKGDDLASKKTTTLSTALQGSVSGLMVRRDNNEPGASAKSMHIRGVTTMGDSSPLIIVDGVQCDNIDYVNPNDVESVSVLK
nr:carboxypeptidase-like regulatory domain-containing protein [Muribaculaceae bacterium]